MRYSFPALMDLVQEVRIEAPDNTSLGVFTRLINERIDLEIYEPISLERIMDALDMHKALREPYV